MRDMKLPETAPKPQDIFGGVDINMAREPVIAWILNDGKIGTLNQCLGLVEALGLEPEIKIVKPRPLWRFLPASWWPAPLKAQTPGGDRLEPPWPDLIVCCGRAAAAPTAEIGRLSGGRTKIVAIQNPRIDPKRFDLIVVAVHDSLRGPNVLATEGALHRVTPAKLEQGRAQFEPVFAHLPRPLVAVLIGGTNAHYRLDEAGAAEIGRKLADLSATTGAGLVITPSRRTDPAAIAAMRANLPTERTWFWDGNADNPYFGMLALADHVLVTADSVSMASEATATGKPVHILDLPGAGGKFGTFHERLRQLGVARKFDGTLPNWQYNRLDDTGRAADAVRALLADRR
jgi:mitochondrial fission protein ELM1